MVDDRRTEARPRCGSIHQDARRAAVSFSPDGKFLSFDQKDRADATMTLGPANRRRGAGRSRGEVAIQGGVGQVLAGRSLGGVHVDRVGQAGDLRAGFPRAWPEAPDFERRRHRPCVASYAAESSTTARQQDDGGRSTTAPELRRLRPQMLFEGTYYERNGLVV